eukprot:CCRYP_003846-RB/>CCRYP_003846-RB protein AED:0.02 eAED:0.02 QI:613/1/1/1/1/0.75/4/200/759
MLSFFIFTTINACLLLPSMHLLCTPLYQGKAPSSGSKKKSTPNKRPASAISIGNTSSMDRSISPNNRSKRSYAAEHSDPKSPKSQPQEKSSQPTTQQISESSRDAITYKSDTTTQNAASRDTLLDYHFSTTSNPSRTATTSGSRLASSPPAPPSKTTAVAQKSTGQKKLDMFLLRAPPKHKNGMKLHDKSTDKDEDQGKVPAGAKSSESKPTRHRQSLSSAVNDAINSEATNSTQLQIAQLHEKINNLQKQLEEATSQNKAIKNNQTMVTLQLQATLKNRTAQLEELKQDSNARITKAMNVIEHLVREDSVRKAQELRQKLASDGARLGRLVTSRVHGGMRSHPIESWEDGNGPKLLKLRRGELRKKRERLEKRWAELNLMEMNHVAIKDNSALPLADGEESNAHEERPMDDLERFEARETIRMHLEEVKREETKLDEEERALNLEKRAHVRALKLVANEDTSKFRPRHKLHDRYIPLNILGKGGFSEVWRAYDLVDLRHVAVKIHQLEASWSDAKKENYTKHVSREYEIHREVRHPRIVSLYDVFEIDTDSFATVLECCEGTDLDTVLKDQGRLGERDARAILLQVLSGMRYLSTPSADGRRQGIIHYDLKPGNILFDGEGRAKITDFGLSKIVDTEDLGEGMELTSQGAGTYWYLPPECFLTDQDVRISNKVDVWSIGVIYFQMLFGRRPFGDGESQDKVLRNQTMLNATEVHFPSKPVISDGAKEFIRECLTYDQMHRPTVSQLCEHCYLRATSID